MDVQRGKAGLLYAFNTMGDPSIYKVGLTTNTFSERCKGYIGPIKPRTVVFTKNVDDCVKAEKLMLMLMQNSRVVESRVHDLGPEWFSAAGDFEVDIRHKVILEYANIVTAAVATKEIRRVYERTDMGRDCYKETRGCHGVLGMETYFNVLQKYVNIASCEILESPESLLDSFENSDICPVYAEYVLHSRESRLESIKLLYHNLWQ